MQDREGRRGNLRAEAIGGPAGTSELVPGSGDPVQGAAIQVQCDHAGAAYDHDIAPIRLARAPRVPHATIRVPDAAFGDDLGRPGVAIMVTGWSLIEGGGQPVALRRVQIRMMDRTLCNAALMEARAEEAAGGVSQAAGVPGLREDDA